jgi:hypothetical protein
MSNTLMHPWKIDPRTGCRLEALGMRPPRRGETGDQPIWPIMGASDDDDADDEGDDAGDDGADDGDDEDDAGDDGDDPDAGKSPEDLRAELKALRASRAKLLREKRNLAKNGKKDDADGKDTFTKDDVEALREETQAAARAALMPAIIRSSSRAALESLGMAFPKDAEQAKAKLTRTLKLADIDDLELDDDGEVVGLEHALREVRRNYPELFRGGRVRTPGNAGGGRRPGDKPKSATELQAAMVFGGRDDD